MNVVNDVCPLLLEVQDGKVPLLLGIPWYQRWIFGLQVTFCLGLHTPYVITSVDERIFAHIQGHVGLSVQVGYYITQLVIMIVDKAYLLAVNFMGEGESRPTTVTDFDHILRLYPIM